MQRTGRGTGTRIAALLAIGLALAVGALAAPAAPAARAATSAGSPLTALTWNTIAVNTVRAVTPSLFQSEGLIYMSYVQASVYDAVTKIEGGYQPYHDFAAPVDAEGASPDAAVAAATYTVLANYFPLQASSLNATYTAFIDGLPDAGKNAGIAVGRAAAEDIIAFRAGDGRNAVISTPYGQGPVTPGVWTFAPAPSLQSAQTPWVAFTTPFMLPSASQFRPGPPLRLESKKYATELTELENYGASNSTLRTPEETATAQFWNANAINQVNQMLRDISSSHVFDLLNTTRALAMGNLVDSDSAMACFDAKYHYTFWRPVTAIRNADIDGNDLTTADPSWTPLLVTPNHPEYPAAHGCLTAADGEVAAKLLGTQDIEIDIRGAVNGGTTLAATRHYATVDDLDTEIVNARVWAGLHFRDSGETGVKLGQKVAHWSIENFFRPVR